MNILTQNFSNVLFELVKSQFNFSFDNYISLMIGLDKALNQAIINAIVTILEKLDEDYKHSKLRKDSYHIKINKVPRTLVTVFGELTYHRTWYVDKRDKKTTYCHIDRIFGLPKNDIYDPYVKALIIDYATSHSAPKTAEIAEEVIGPKIKFEALTKQVRISRQLVANILSKIPKIKIIPNELDTPDTIFIMADEKWVARQGNDGKDTEVKLAVCFDAYDRSKKRTKLLNKHYVSSVAGVDSIRSELLDYIYTTYDTNRIKKVVLMGDGANWIKNTTRDLKFNHDTKVVFALDHFHLKQALLHITKDDTWGYFAFKFILDNNKRCFTRLVSLLATKYPHRKKVLENKFNYVMNNWTAIQNMIYNPNYKCSMEGHISHVLADLFASRPKGYGIKTLTTLLNLRTLKKNGYDVRAIYLDVASQSKSEVTLTSDDMINIDNAFKDSSSTNIPIIKNGNLNTFPANALLGMAHG